MLFSAVNPLHAVGRLRRVTAAALNSFCNTAVCSLTKLQQINPVLSPCVHTSRSPPLLCTISLIKNPTRWVISVAHGYPACLKDFILLSFVPKQGFWCRAVGQKYPPWTAGQEVHSLKSSHQGLWSLHSFHMATRE